MTKEDLEKSFRETGASGELLDDIQYYDSVEDLIACWEFRAEEIRRYIAHAQQFSEEPLTD